MHREWEIRRFYGHDGSLKGHVALNPYAVAPPDFEALCRADSALARAVAWREGDKVTVNFRDGQSVRALSEAILRHDFGITAGLPEDRLCPPIPNRLNYLAWIQELLDGTCSDALRHCRHAGNERDTADIPVGKRRKDQDDDGGSVRILDIGTGASCIYPILGSSLHADWRFVGTDIDSVSLRNAQTIIDDPRNNSHAGPPPRFARHAPQLSKQITLLQRHSQDSVIPALNDVPPFSAVMCNPPFYKDLAEMQRSLEGKRELPNAVCHGSEGEMICEGGELAFVKRIIVDSLAVPRAAIWFTAMIGKLADVQPLVDELKRRGIENYAVTELLQGVTKRWAIAWSHLFYRLPPPVIVLPATLRVLQPSPGQHHLSVDGRSIDPASLCSDLRSFVCSYTGVSCLSRSSRAAYIIAQRDSWSRKARRRNDTPHVDAASQDPALITLVNFTSEQASFTVTWTYGRQRQLFDSFVMSVLSAWSRRTH